MRHSSKPFWFETVVIQFECLRFLGLKESGYFCIYAKIPIFKLRRITSVNLVVLLAVGNIHDDAIENFLMTADDLDADYMIVDAIDVARLFIAFHKICPNDGTVFQNGMCIQCQTSVSEPIELTLKVFENPRYDIDSSEEISSSGAKRYRVDVVTDPHYSKGTFREIIKEVTWRFRKADFFRSKRVEARFKGKDTDCVFLYLFLDRRDLQQRNWICQATWIDPELPKKYRPFVTSKAQEKLGGIEIHWQESYHWMKELWSTSLGTKEDWFQKIDTVFPRIEDIITKTVNYLDLFETNKLSQHDLEIKLYSLEAEAYDILQDADGDKVPPIECQECDNYFQGMAGTCHNILIDFLPKTARLNSLTGASCALCWFMIPTLS